MTIGIYGIFDVRDGSCLYAGQSKVIEERWKRHLSHLRSGKHRRLEFNDHFKEIDRDESLLELRILEECDNVNLIKNEIEIKWFYSLEPKFFGQRPSLKDKWSHSIETRAKISLSQIDLYRERFGPEYEPFNRTKYERCCKFCRRTFGTTQKEAKFCSKECVTAKYTKVDDEQVSKMYTSGMSMTEIAISLQVSQPGVLRSLKRSKTEIRSRAEALRLKSSKKLLVIDETPVSCDKIF